MNLFAKTLSTFMLMVLVSFVAGCTKPDEPNNGGNNGNDTIVNNGDDSLVVHEYVDLGLPSGTLWAVSNLGASGPEEVGDYFAWGETGPKERYDWKVYKYCKFVEGDYLMTKYCTNSNCGYNGFVDSLTVLEPIDDAATANWGADWRMPTREEWSELLSSTTNMVTDRNGVSGRLLTGANGNSLFLPNTGFYLEDEVICPNLGIYWSSTLQTTFQIVAWSYHSDSEECHVCGTYERSRGQCVRAIRATK